MKPLISIVTAVFNGAATITDCLQSISSQTCPCQHIIVDGASTDETLDIISRFTPHSSHFIRIISEPDKGIYDAMNKGLRLATGDIIGILNADDLYATPDVLAKVAALFDDPAIEACYGDLEYVENSEKLPRKSELGELSPAADDSPLTIHRSHFTVVRNWKSGIYNRNKFKWGWMPPHPTFFVRRSVYERHGLFNLQLGSAADYELMLRFLYVHGIRTAYIPEVLVLMRSGGASNESLAARIKANRMDRKAWKINGLKPYPWTLLLKPLRKLPQYFLM